MVSNAKFKFPAASYYQESKSMHDKMTSFSDDMDVNFFDVIDSNISSLDHRDQGVISRPVTQGKQKQRSFVDSFVQKWKDMQSEQTSNPMYGVVEVDKKYKQTFSEFQSGGQQKKITAKQGQFERAVATDIFGDGALLDEMIDMMQEGGDSDLYSRLTQATSLGSFLDEFSRRFGHFAEKNPEQAQKLLDQLQGSEKFNKVVDRAGNSKFYKKLRKSPGLKNVGKTSRWLSRGKNIFNGKFVRTGVSFGKKHMKGPWATVVGGGFHGYDNFKDEEVQKDFTEGKNLRASTKATTGTALDVVSDLGPIDGVIGGAMVGGLAGAIAGGALGAGNQTLQFFYPDAYEDTKELANQSIDWTYDKAQQGWDATKEFGNSAWEGAVELKDSVESNVRGKVNNVKQSLHTIKEGALTAVKTVEKSVEVTRKAKGIWDRLKPAF